MRIQIHTYLNNPSGSICNVAANWIRVLSRHHEVKVNDFSRDCRFEDIRPLLGEFNLHPREVPVSIYIAFPSYIKTTGNPAARHAQSIGVFVCETRLNQLEHNYISSFKKIVVPSQYCKNWFASAVPETKIQVIHHGIDPVFQPISMQGEAGFTYLFIFNTSPSGGSEIRKNVRVLLGAFDIVKKKIPEARLILKTTPNTELDLEKEKRRHPGLETISLHIPKEELAKLYNRCNVYVNPTSAEGFGMTALEAMACGTPVVSPVHTGMTEFLSNSNCVQVPCELGKENFSYSTNHGPIYKIKKIDLANAMISAYNEYNQLVVNATGHSEYIRERFSWENVLQGLTQWLTILNRKP